MNYCALSDNLFVNSYLVTKLWSHDFYHLELDHCLNQVRFFVSANQSSSDTGLAMAAKCC